MAYPTDANPISQPKTIADYGATADKQSVAAESLKELIASYNAMQGDVLSAVATLTGLTRDNTGIHYFDNGLHIDGYLSYTPRQWYQELTVDKVFSAASGWRTVTGDGLTYLGVGSVKAGDVLDLTGAARLVGGDYSFALSMYQGGSTCLRRWTMAGNATDASASVSARYAFSSDHSDVRVYLEMYTPASVAMTAKAGVAPETYTHMSAILFKK